MGHNIRKYTTSLKLVGIILFLSLCACLAYYNYKPLNYNELVNVSGYLSQKPYATTTGGNTPHYLIMINIVGFEKNRYFVIDCSYYVSKQNEILNLQEGDWLELWVKQQKPNDLYYVYNILSADSTLLLNIDDYNLCESKEYIRILKYAFFILILIILMIIVNMFSKSDVFR